MYPKEMQKQKEALSVSRSWFPKNSEDLKEKAEEQEKPIPKKALATQFYMVDEYTLLIDID